ncbi:hypothetical protein Godav_028037, partial [Gossypium davidsonii]|nr:hypothetical protein [Gossypium davidsonii]
MLIWLQQKPERREKDITWLGQFRISSIEQWRGSVQDIKI